MANVNSAEEEKNITSALISGLSNLSETPTKEVVELKAKALAEVFGFEGDLSPIVNEAMIAVDTKMGLGVSLIDVEADHDEEWVYNRDDITWTYANAYEKYLKSEKWNPNVVQKLSDVSRQILGLLQDPVSVGDTWDRRGLVIGSVQSGKTANYLSVVARAADAGYKFIIIIAGLHNNLRKQTQERVDEGFVGRSSDPENRKVIGVGRLEGKDYPHPATLTNIYKDFNKVTAGHSGWKINDFSKPIVLVIKKNVHTLNALHNWLKELNAQGDGRIKDIPMLMIDDEADNASVNTNKEDLDPTKTNAMLRKILGLFDKSCYVGYTATPFANIFINPDNYDDEVFKELFPKDFIYCLDAPSSYFGPNKVFIDDETSERILEKISDAEEYLPFSHKKDFEIQDLPPSLYKAIFQFIVAKAIRNLRGQVNKHNSMLINVSRFVAIQDSVRDFVSVFIKKMAEAIKANYKMPDTVSQQNFYMKELEGTFSNTFGMTEFQWQDVKSNLNDVFENLRLVVINGKSQDRLDYDKFNAEGKGLTAIAIGGLSLSRGVTIEGLCISYMYRNTKMYDTLMQMGRWFGYRPNFEDLCRVHLSEDSINWYAHIAEAAEELKSQIIQMRQDKLSPEKFGLYVKRHPDRLLITAANKMRSGEKITVKHNYSGRQIESDILPVSKKINEENIQLIESCWKAGFGLGAGAEKEIGKGWIIRDVNTEQIEGFLAKFRIHSDLSVKKGGALDYLRAIASKHPLSDVLLISIKSNEPNGISYRLGPQDRKSANLYGDMSAWKTAKNRVASRGDEKLGLSSSQVNEAVKLAQMKDSTKKPSDIHYRTIRHKPLLMIHALYLEDEDSNKNHVPAFGISFPTGDYSEFVEVVANKVWFENTMGAINDESDDEEDDDE